MLKDNFYKYGAISNILHGLIIIIVALMYISVMLNQFGESNFFERIYISFVFILFFILLIKFAWRTFNSAPMSLTTTKVGGFLQKFNLFLIYLVLFAIVFFSFWGYIFTIYTQYEVNVNIKIDFTIFGLVIIPFSVIQLFCYLLTQYLHLDILHLKYDFAYYEKLFLFYFPLLAALYILQKLINYFLYRKQNRPEKLI